MQGWKATWGTRGHVTAPVLLQFWGKPPFAHPPPHPGTAHLESEGHEECGKYLKAAAGARGLLGAAWGGLEGPHRSQSPRRNAATGVQASQGPPSAGRGIWLVGLGRGDHGFRLHSGQSFPGTPELPGNRAGTRPPSAPWPAAGSAASSRSGRCPPRPRTASAPGRC